MSDLHVKIKYVSDLIGQSVPAPFYATEGSAGMDLSACLINPVTIKIGEIAMIPTGIAIGLPSAELGAFIYARSGIASKFGICLANGVGVVDSDYTGEIKCPLINLGKKAFTVFPGDRIAQMVIQPVAKVQLDVVADLDRTDRGSGGFGSTGI